MKNKGLTLVELIAVLVVLAIIAMIVTPTVTGSIKEYKEEMYTSQLESIKNAAINFSADNVAKDYFPKDEKTALKITLKDLQNGGYIDEKVSNPKDGGEFESEEVFVLVTCDIRKDETLEYKDNYKYTYEVYTSNLDYIISKAKEYAKNNGEGTYKIDSIGIYTKLNGIDGNYYYPTKGYDHVEISISNDEYNITPIKSEV